MMILQSHLARASHDSSFSRLSVAINSLSKEIHERAEKHQRRAQEDAHNEGEGPSVFDWADAVSRSCALQTKQRGCEKAHRELTESQTQRLQTQRASLEGAKKSLIEDGVRIQQRIALLQKEEQENQSFKSSIQSLMDELGGVNLKKIEHFISQMGKVLSPFGLRVSLDHTRGKGSHSLLKLGDQTVTCPRKIKPYILKQIEKILRSYHSSCLDSSDALAELARERDSLIRNLEREKQELLAIEGRLGQELLDLYQRGQSIELQLKEVQNEIDSIAQSFESIYYKIY